MKISIEEMEELEKKLTAKNWPMLCTNPPSLRLAGEDAIFACRSREFVPWACAEIRRLNEKLKIAATLLKEIKDWADEN